MKMKESTNYNLWNKIIKKQLNKKWMEHLEKKKEKKKRVRERERDG